jgi:hypothetical protein
MYRIIMKIGESYNRSAIEKRSRLGAGERREYNVQKRHYNWEISKLFYLPIR